MQLERKKSKTLSILVEKVYARYAKVVESYVYSDRPRLWQNYFV